MFIVSTGVFDVQVLLAVLTRLFCVWFRVVDKAGCFLF